MGIGLVCFATLAAYAAVVFVQRIAHKRFVRKFDQRVR